MGFAGLPLAHAVAVYGRNPRTNSEFFGDNALTKKGEGRENNPRWPFKKKEWQNADVFAGLEGFAEFFQAIQTFVDGIQPGGVGEADRAVIAKGDSGNNSYMVFTQKSFGKVGGIESQLGDVG